MLELEANTMLGLCQCPQNRDELLGVRNVVTTLERTEGTDGGLGWGNVLRVCPQIVDYKKGERPTCGLRIRLWLC
jgi:hypothetical protein